VVARARLVSAAPGDAAAGTPQREMERTQKADGGDDDDELGWAQARPESISLRSVASEANLQRRIRTAVSTGHPCRRRLTARCRSMSWFAAITIAHAQL
jgi:hypothetical protein